MSGDADFVAYALELLQPLGRCSARKMFGGYGIYGDGLMFAIAFDGRLFLKVDDATKADFVAAGCAPFVYEGQNKPIEMSYWTVPESALESSEDMLPWARRALAAALRKANSKPARKTISKRTIAKKAPKKKPTAGKRAS